MTFRSHRRSLPGVRHLGTRSILSLLPQHHAPCANAWGVKCPHPELPAGNFVGGSALSQELDAQSAAAFSWANRAGRLTSKMPVRSQKRGEMAGKRGQHHCRLRVLVMGSSSSAGLRSRAAGFVCRPRAASQKAEKKKLKKKSSGLKEAVFLSGSARLL